jgi:hypothetical protein
MNYKLTSFFKIHFVFRLKAILHLHFGFVQQLYFLPLGITKNDLICIYS